MPKGTTAWNLVLSKIEEKMAMNFKLIEELYEDSRFAQNSAIDFIMDENLEIYLLEINNQYN